MKTNFYLYPLNRFALLACLSFGPIFIANRVSAQSIHFSQFYEVSVLRNPALTGIFTGDYKVGVDYRSQWGSISVPFQTVMASAETKIPINKDVNDFLSFGISAAYDKAGSIAMTGLQVYPAISFNKTLEDDHDTYLSAGFTAGYIQRSFDVNKITTSEQIVNGVFNPGLLTGENITNTSMSYYDLGAGISLNSSIGQANNINYYIGLAGYNLTQPDIKFGNATSKKAPVRLSGNFGFLTQLDRNFGLVFHANYMSQGKVNQTVFGGMLGYRAYDFRENTTLTIYAGGFYRWNDAVIPTIKVDYRQYSFTFSYDVNTSNLSLASNNAGGLELSIFSRGVLDSWRWSKKKPDFPGPRFEMMSPNF